MSTHDAPFENDVSVVSEIVRSVSGLLDTPVDELPSLEGTVDTEMLQRLADSGANESVRRARVTFEYAGLTVTVDVDGELRIETE